MKTTRLLPLAALVVAAFSSSIAFADDALPIEQAVLLAPPQVPPAIARKTPARVVVNLTVEEVEREIAPGARYTF